MSRSLSSRARSHTERRAREARAPWNGPARPITALVGVLRSCAGAVEVTSCATDSARSCRRCGCMDRTQLLAQVSTASSPNDISTAIAGVRTWLPASRGRRDARRVPAADPARPQPLVPGYQLKDLLRRLPEGCLRLLQLAEHALERGDGHGGGIRLQPVEDVERKLKDLRAASTCLRLCTSSVQARLVVNGTGRSMDSVFIPVSSPSLSATMTRAPPRTPASATVGNTRHPAAVDGRSPR